MKPLALHIVIVCLLAVNGLFAQELRHTNQAAIYCKSKDYAAAMTEIQLALNDPAESTDAYAWYVKGFIYKEIYKDKEQGQNSSKTREEAIDAFFRSMELDAAGKHKQMNLNALKYLATSYYNDALVRSKEVDASNAGECIELFSKFRRVIRTIDPSSNLASFEVELYKSLGQRHYALWETDIQRYAEAEAASDAFKSALRIDSLDCDANYNLSIVYYNQAVFKIRNLGAGTDIMTLIIVQDECVALFKKSLPYMNKCFSDCQAKTDYFKGMMFINRALGRDKDYEKYRTGLEDAINTGAIKTKD
jgi:tetratricopeptide (TPR) repeat protein